jgi:DNA-binding FadR family transcriptional regulator
MYQTIQPSRLFEQMAGQIRERILHNDIQIGERLPNEHELAEQFGVSRTVVREAMKTLEKEGLVQVQPGRGTFVIYGTEQAIKDSLNNLIRFEQSSDWSSLTEVREILEPAIAALAAERADPQHIESLIKAVNTMDEFMEDADAYINADNDFHLLLAKATGNTLLICLVEPIVGLLTEQRKRIFVTRGGPQRGQQHHKAILEAIQRHNSKAARQACLEHLEQINQDSMA